MVVERGSGVEYLPIRPAAERMGVHRTSLYRMIRRGEIEAYRLAPAGQLYVRVDDLERLIEWYYDEERG